MQSNEQGPRAVEPSAEALKLISALAHGDSTVEDVAIQLRNAGLDALDVVLAVVAQAAAAPRDRVRAQRPIDLAHFAQPTPPELVAQTVHPVPQLPFVLNGTFYDPQDIRRFNGRELHSIVAAAGEPILVVDDRAIMARWWELMYLSWFAEAERYRYGGLQSGPEPQGTGAVTVPPPNGDIFLPSPPGRLRPPRTGLCDSTDFEGESLSLQPNRGYWDLTEVGRGILGLATGTMPSSPCRCIALPYASCMSTLTWKARR